MKLIQIVISVTLYLSSFSALASSIDYEKIVQGLGESEEAYPFAYQLAIQQNSYAAWRKVAVQYAHLDDKAFIQAWKKIKEINKESTYKDFLTIRPNALLNLQAIHAIFELTQARNTLADYRQFMETFPNAVESIEAMLKIQALAFERAKQANVPLMYDTFVRTFPGAKQIPEAIELAFQAEKRQIEKESKQWEADFKNNYQGKSPAVKTFIKWMLRDKAHRLLNEAKAAEAEKNQLVAARKYRLLGLALFQPSEIAGEIKQIPYDNSINNFNASLVDAIQHQMMLLEDNLTKPTSLENAITIYNSYAAALDKKSFHLSLRVPLLSMLNAMKLQWQVLKNAFETPNSQQVYLLDLKS
jgi:hypothetical protein